MVRPKAAEPDPAGVSRLARHLAGRGQHDARASSRSRTSTSRSSTIPRFASCEAAVSTGPSARSTLRRSAVGASRDLLPVAAGRDVLPPRCLAARCTAPASSSLPTLRSAFSPWRSCAAASCSLRSASSSSGSATPCTRRCATATPRGSVYSR